MPSPGPGIDTAESTNPTSRLDNAGTLLQSVSTSIIPEKLTILAGHESDFSACTFCLWQEDHSLGNALRWILMKECATSLTFLTSFVAQTKGLVADGGSPDVEFCGYSAPHPSDPKIHLRIQMYDNLSAVDCLRRGLENLRDLLNAVNDKYGHSLKHDEYIQEKDVEVQTVVAETLRRRGFGVVGDDERMDES